MPRRKSPRAPRSTTPQLSHDELRGKLAEHDYLTAIAQLKRAERKAERLVQYSDPDSQRGEESAAATSRIVTTYLEKHLPAGIKTSLGGLKSATRTWGSAAERAAADRARLEWYAMQVHAARAAGRRCTDKTILKMPGRPANLSGRTLRRLKLKYGARLRELLNA